MAHTEYIEVTVPANTLVVTAPAEVIEVTVGQTTVDIEKSEQIEVVHPDIKVVEVFPWTSFGSNYGQKPNPNNPSLNPNPPPNPITNLTGIPGFTTIQLLWSLQKYDWHSHVEVWRNTVDDLPSAIPVGTSRVNRYTDPVEPGTSYYYWVRAVTLRGVVGDWNAQAGTLVSSTGDNSNFLNGMIGALQESHLDPVLQARLDQHDSFATDLLDESNARIAAISQEAATRAAELNNWVSSLRDEWATDLANESAARIAAINSEATTRITNDSAMALQINDLVAAMATETTDRIAAVQSEQSARTSFEEAIALDVTNLTALIQTETNARIAAVDSESFARVTADDAMAADITTLYAADATETAARIAAINSEQTARINADGALASDITTLDTKITDETSARQAAITSEQSARVSGDNAVTNSLNALVSSLQTDSSYSIAAVQAEQTARTSQYNSLASDITSLESSVFDPNTGLPSVASAVETLETNVNVVTAPGSDYQNANVRSQFEGSRLLATWSASSGAPSKATLENGAKAVGDTYTSIASGAHWLQADLGTVKHVSEMWAYWYAQDGRTYSHAIAVSADGSNWEWLVGSGSGTTVSGYVQSRAPTPGSHSSGAEIPTITGINQFVRYIRIYCNGNTSNTGNHWYEIEIQSGGQKNDPYLDQQLVDVSAQWTVKLDVNGKVAGVGLMNSGTTSTFEIEADNFKVYQPGTTNVILGTTINGAYMQSASIQNAAIANLDAAKINTGTLNAARIGAGSIVASKLSVTTLSSINANLGTVTAGIVRSSDSNFKIDLNAKTLLLRKSATGARMEIHDNVIKVFDSSGTLRVKMGNLAA